MQGPYWRDREDDEEGSGSDEDEEIPEAIMEEKFERFYDGDYVYQPAGVSGVLYVSTDNSNKQKNGGIVIDKHDPEFMGGLSLEDEWKNALLRESFAKSSLLKLRNISGSTYFSKGKLHELGEFIQNTDVEVVFVNAVLTPL